MAVLFYLMYNDIHVMLFQVGCLEGMLMVCWAHAWSAPLCPHTYTFVNKFNLKVHIHDVHSFDHGQAGKELQLPLRTYPPQQHHKNQSPHNSLNTNKHDTRQWDEFKIPV